MSNVPTNLIPTRITGLPEYTGTSTLGYIPYILDGRTYKVQFGQIAAVGAVPSTRVIAAGTGLTGGGDLSENRVISIAPGGVGFDQLAVSGATAGTYGNSGNIPVVTVDSKGRVTNVETVPLVANGYVPTSRLVSAGVGLLGGGSLTDNITLSVNFYASAPQALGSATPGVSNAAARGDHVHPAVDLSDANQTQGALPLGRGGTGDALSPVAGAVVYSTGTKFALADPGIPGQVLTSAGTGEPYWQTIEGTGTVTSVAVLTGNGFAGTVNNPNTVAEITLSTTVTGLVKGNGTALSAAVAGTDYVAPGAITGSGLTMATDRLLGRTTALTGAVEQITVGSGLSLSAGVLSSTVGGTVTSVAASGGSTGLTFSGSPITTSGTLTLGGTLVVASGGTGATTAAGARTNLGAAASGANSDITSLSGITGSISTVDSITFDTATNTTPVAGQTGWNIDFGTTTRGLGNGTVILDGMDTVVYAANAEATTLARGEVVYIFGSTGSRATVKRAANTGDATSTMTIGFVKDPITAGGSGYIVTQGVVDKLNTSSFTSGDTIYLGATPGTYTNVKPYAPNHIVILGVVERANAGNGQIYVAVNNGWELNELHNVSAQTPSNGQVIIYNASTSLWQAANLTAGTNVSITNGPGSITINASDQFTGTVTSVAASGGTTGLTFSGSPITTSGTLTLGGTLAVASGGTGATSAATARTNLGAAKSGANTDITSIALTTGTITTAPTAGTDIANKAYVDTISAGINFHQAVRLASAAALPAYTYNNGSSGVGATITANANGALTLDGVAAATNDRVLIKNETSGNAPYNGVYVVTQTGSGAAPFILTRASDFNTAGTGVNQIDAGDFFLVTAGSTQANTSWVQQTPLPITVGTTALVFTQFGAPITYSAGTGLTLAGTVFSIANTGVTATSYGSASAVPVIAVNAQGQITSASNTSIAISGSQVTSGSVAVAQGGTGATTASGARTNLGATTVGGNFFTLANPSAITFPQINADNTVSALDAASFRAAIGAGTGGGSVTSVNAAGGTTGMTFSGGPITSSGTLTLGGILGVANGGTGATTLTSNYLLKGNGVSSVSSSIIFDNGTNVGIGTASPASKLDVSGTTTTGNITVRGDGVEGGQITFNNLGNTAGPLILDVDGFGRGRLFTTANNADLILGQLIGTGGVVTFSTSGVERMRVDTSGNVGIGTSSPGFRLDVTGTGRFTGLTQFDNDITLNKATLNYLYFNDALAFARNGVGERMRIDINGNVGIGTSAPSMKLDVYGGSLGTTAGNTLDITDVRGATGNNTRLVTRLVRGSNGSDWTTAALRLQAVVDVTNQAYIDMIPAGATYGLTFGTGGGGTPVERMRIDSGGNVNIGASAATAAGGIRYLDIYNTENTSGASATDIRLITQNAAGSGTTTLDLIKYKSGAFYIANAETGSGGIIGFNTSSTERARIDASGNFMVGTTSATGLLSVAGLVYGQMVATDRFGLLGNNLYYGSGNFRYVGNGHAYGWAQGNTDGADLRLLYAGNNTSGGGAVASPTERIYITAAGNVGIGTSSPDANAKLDVAGTIRSGVGGSDPGTGTALYFVGSGAFQSVVAGAAFAVHTGNNNARTERMRVDISGNVGIGTSSPGAKLQINAQDGFRFDVETGAASTMRFGSASTGEATAALAFTRTTGVISLSSGSTGSALNERMRIDGSGNVAIGTTTTASRLRVAAGAQINAPVLGNVTNYPAFLSGPDTGFGLGIGTNNADGRTWLQSQRSDGGTATYPITLNEAGGNVGIGTSAPGSKLTVVGGAVQQYKASGDNNAFYGSTSDTSNNYLRLQNSVNTVDVTCSNGSAYLNSAQSVLWFGNNGVERMRLSGSELLVGTTSGGRSLCLFGSDVWQRIQNASRSWLLGMGTGSSFIIYDETSGLNRFVVDTSGNWNGQNSIALGAGVNLDNKIEIGAGRTGNNFAYIDLIGDTTYTDFGLRLLRGNGGPNTYSQLVHRGTGDMYITTQDAATLYFQTNATTRAYFQSDGTMVMSGALLVGRNTTGSNVNTNNDTGSFSVRGDGSNAASMSFHRTGAYAINMGLGTDAVFRIGGWSASSNCFQMDGSGNLTMLGNVTAYSDARIKKDVETIGSALDLVSKMRGVRYTRIDSGKRGVGVIAQEMLEVLPEVVQQGVGDDDTLSVAYGNLVGVLIEAVKELRAEVAELKGK